MTMVKKREKMADWILRNMLKIGKKLAPTVAILNFAKI